MLVTGIAAPPFFSVTPFQTLGFTYGFVISASSLLLQQCKLIGKICHLDNITRKSQTKWDNLRNGPIRTCIKSKNPCQMRSYHNCFFLLGMEVAGEMISGHGTSLL